MPLSILGLNHATADIAVRERLAFAPEQLVEALQQAQAELGSASELAIVSTCNRTEMIVAGSVDEARLVEWLARYHDLDASVFTEHLYRYREADAVRHMIRVASGLDSMVLGEPQIFGQLKSAVAVAREADTVSVTLEPVFQQVFSCAKRVRSSTAIGENPISIAYAAVALAQRIFARLNTVSALLIGAGETIELVARHLLEAGVDRIVVANRTLTRARELAETLGAKEILLADVPDALLEADIVISSTASQLPVLGKGAVERALKYRKREPIFMVDLAVPRDIEPQVAELADVYLYSVDDLHDIIDHNRQLRVAEVDKASDIVEAGVDAYLRHCRSRQASDVLVNYRRAMEQLRDVEAARALAALRAGRDAEQVLEQLARSLTNKLMHGPTVAMRQAAEQQQAHVLEVVQSLFDPDDNGIDRNSAVPHTLEEKQ